MTIFKQIKKTEIIELEGFHSIDGKGYDIGLKVTLENRELKNYSINTKRSSQDWNDEYSEVIKPSINAKLVSLAMAEVLKIDEQCKLPEKGQRC